MKTRNRILLAALGGFLASCGALVGTGGELAHASPIPQFPTCSRAPVDGNYDQMRVWLNPGSLYDPNTVSVKGEQLYGRRDGIFTGVVERPEQLIENYVLFDFDGSENGVWVKCKRVKP